MSNTQISRERTEEFFILRRASRQQQQWLSQQPGSRVPPPLQDYHRPTNIPPWAEAVSEFGKVETQVTDRIDNLFALHRDVLAPAFGQSEDEVQQLKDRCNREADTISKAIKDLSRLIEIRLQKTAENTDDEIKAIENVGKLLLKRWKALTDSFRQAQESYAKETQKRERRKQELTGGYAPDGWAERIEREEQEVEYLAMGYTQAEIAELLIMQKDEQEKSVAVQEIMKGVIELNDMFKDLNTMIVEQGTMLDRIDHNITMSVERVEKGNQELKKARSHQKKCLVQ